MKIINVVIPIVATLCLSAFMATAQPASKIRTGAKLTYMAIDPGAAVSLPISLTVPVSGGMVINYTVKQPGKSFNGKISISKDGLEKGNALSWGDMSPDENRKLGSSETAFCFSRSFYSQLMKSKSAVYSDVTYTLQNNAKESRMKVGAKTLTVLYVVGANGTKFWILNDPKYPLMLKVTGNQEGPNLKVTSVSGL